MQAFVVGQMGGGTLMKGFAVQVLQERGIRVSLVWPQGLCCSTLQYRVPRSISDESRGEFRQTYM